MAVLSVTPSPTSPSSDPSMVPEVVKLGPEGTLASALAFAFADCEEVFVDCEGTLVADAGESADDAPLHADSRVAAAVAMRQMLAGRLQLRDRAMRENLSLSRECFALFVPVARGGSASERDSGPEGAVET